MDSITPLLAAGTGGALGAGEWSALLFYVVVALGVSFLCSIWEAAMLSTRLVAPTGFEVVVDGF